MASETNNNYLQDMVDKGPRFLNSEIIMIRENVGHGYELFNNS